jgi:hypothetical protein
VASSEVGSVPWLPVSTYPLAVVITGVDRFTAPLTRVNDRLAKLTAPTRAFKTALGRFRDESGLRKLGDDAARVRERMAEVGHQTRQLGKRLILGELIGGIALGAFIRRKVESGSQLNNQSKQLGMSATALKRYQYIAGQADVDQESFNQSLTVFNKLLGQARGRKGNLYEQLIGAPNTLRQLVAAKDTAASFDIVLEKMSQIKNPQELARFMEAVFGRGGLSMARLKMSQQELADLRKEFDQTYGSQEAFAENAELADRASKRFGFALEGTANLLAAQFFPALTLGANALTRFLIGHRAQFEQWAKDLAPKVERFAEQLPERLERIANLFSRLYSAAKPFGDLVGGRLNLALMLGGLALAGPWVRSLGALTLSIGRFGFAALKSGRLLRLALGGGGVIGGAAPGVGAAVGEGVAGAAAGVGAAGGVSLGAAVPVIGILAAIGISVYAVKRAYDNMLSSQQRALNPSRPHRLNDDGREMPLTLADAEAELFRRNSQWDPSAYSEDHPIQVDPNSVKYFRQLPNFGPPRLGGTPLDQLSPTAKNLGRPLRVELSDESIEKLADNMAGEIDKRGRLLSGQHKLTVDMSGLPRGARVRPSGALPSMIELASGYTMAEAQ